MPVASWVILWVLSACVVPTPAYGDCPPITLGAGSALYPQATIGRNITMYRVFETEGDVSALNITWSRHPCEFAHCPSNASNTTTVLSNNSLKASLSIQHLKTYPDYGTYIVKACSNCTCNDTTFFLYLFECSPEDLPEPVQLYRQMIIAETSLPHTLELYVVFVGLPKGSFFYSTVWDYEGHQKCYESDPNSLCNRTGYGNCSFTANLYIPNPAHNYSGNYTVQAVGSENAASAIATYQLSIVKEPDITCSQHNIVVGSRIHCTVRNYSEYIDVVIVKDDVNETAVYPVSDVCQQTVQQDREMAKCSIELSEGHFNVCVGYNNSVHSSKRLPHCSSYIHVHGLNFWEKHEVAILSGSVPGVVLLVIGTIVAVGIVCYCCRRRRKNGSTQEPGERTRLIGCEERQRSSPPTTTEEIAQDNDRDRGHCVGIGNPPPIPSLHDIGSMRGGEYFDELDHASSQPTNRRPSPVIGATPAISSSTTREKSVLLISAKNPGENLQIRPPVQITDSQERMFDDEVCTNEDRRWKNTEEHVQRVIRLAIFLESRGITVAHEQQLDDTYVSSKLAWFEEKVEISEYIVLIITPSFPVLLRQNDVPNEETFFKGDLLRNLISGHVKRKDRSEIKFVCFFLNSPIEPALIPGARATGYSYCLMEPFDIQPGRADDVEAFMSLIEGHRKT